MPLPDDNQNIFAIDVGDHGMWAQRKLLEKFLHGPIRRDWPFIRQKGAIRIGWGRKPSGLRAERIAARTGADVWRLEDGFLRSRGLGGQEPPLSIVADDLGIYYDCSRPSRLERLISQQMTSSEKENARRIAATWREARVSKYNCHPEFSGELPDDYVLVADQTRNDHSILYGGASAASFEAMLDTAIHENPNSQVIVKTHPDVLAGKKSGYFTMDITSRSRNIALIADWVHPVRLIEHARKVYTVTSQIGFEALIWGKPVRTFGMPFYAGWGLTEDEISPPAERQRVDIEDLIHAALVEYPTYKIPNERHPVTIIEVISNIYP